jgi:hypothetical protein
MHSSVPLAQREPLSPKPANMRRAGLNWRAICIVALGLFATAMMFSAFSHTGRSYPGSSTDSPALLSRWVPVTVSLVHGQFQVPAQNYLSWPIAIPAMVRNYHVVGHYSVIGGFGNDIQAVIASEDEFQNWINGHQAHVFYSTPDRVTTGNIDVVLPPGQYALAFNNRFSLFASKALFAEISATYERLN